MEPFDYLTYKKNKSKEKQYGIMRKRNISIISSITFIIIFALAMNFIASKSSKIDIEYGRLGEQSREPVQNEPQYGIEESEEEIQEGKYTIDKRLFLIQQEEKGPSESKIVKPNNSQQEVISTEEFKQIRNNSDQVIKKAEKLAKEEQNSAKEDIASKNNQNSTNTENKIAIKPKLPVSSKPEIKQYGSFEGSIVQSKVLIGKYQTMEEARKTQLEASRLVQGTVPFVKKINNYYSVQIGSYESFEIAKAIAAKLKSQGLDVWIYQ